MKENKRFKLVFSEKESITDYFEIWVDTETGVNYLWRHGGYAGGLTVLLDAEGKPVITK